MSGPSKVIVLDPDQRAGRLAQLGFEREGIATFVPEIPAQIDNLELDGIVPAIVMVGGTGVELVRHARKLLTAKGTDVPIVFTGRGATRGEIEAAGADEIMLGAVYLRDVVTIARLLSGVPSGQRDHLVGSLVETTGVLTLVRALTTLGRSAVLTLIRGLRRGEVRFYGGEVTSAQVGLIHGQAALHQLLLWTDARFDYAHEDIVRRQQIPLSPDELFTDAESFLEGVREHAGNLSPATVLEQEAQRVHALAKQIPTEVHGILRMFDGHRVLADVLEDSPYRVFETLRVTLKAVEAGLLKTVDAQRPKASWRAVLAIEEWLVGNETRDDVVDRTATLDSGPVSARRKRKGKGKRRSKKMKAVTPSTPAIKDSKDIDWGALVPRGIGAEVGPLAQVVPAMEAHGEVETSTRDKPREGLEALMDTDKRQKIFPTDIGVEPSVVVAVPTGDTDEWQRVELEAKSKIDQEEAATTPTPEPAQSDAAKPVSAKPAPAPAQTATAVTAKPERVQPEPAADDEEEDEQSAIETGPMRTRRRRRKSDLQAVFAAKAKAIAPELIADSKHLATVPVVEAEAKAISPADDAKAFAARVKAAAETKRAKSDSAPPASIRAKSDSAPPASIRAQAESAAAASTRGTSESPAATSTRGTSESALPEEISPRSEALPSASPAPRPEPERAADLVRALTADAVPGRDAAIAPAFDAPSDATTVPVPRMDAETTPYEKPVAHIAAPITVAETNATSVSVADVVTVKSSGDTAVVSATPRMLISEASPPAATPIAADDEPSDGIVRSMITSLDTARLTQLRQRSSTPEHDGPAIKETSGEIKPLPASAPVAKSPDLLDEPSILVADLAAAHTAIAAAAAKPAGVPPADAASASRELEVSDTRRDAVSFSEAEEAFFSKVDQTLPKVETFEDLDEGYHPQGFWDRVFGRNPKK